MWFCHHSPESWCRLIDPLMCLYWRFDLIWIYSTVRFAWSLERLLEHPVSETVVRCTMFSVFLAIKTLFSLYQGRVRNDLCRVVVCCIVNIGRNYDCVSVIIRLTCLSVEDIVCGQWGKHVSAILYRYCKTI